MAMAKSMGFLKLIHEMTPMKYYKKHCNTEIYIVQKYLVSIKRKIQDNYMKYMKHIKDMLKEEVHDDILLIPTNHQNLIKYDPLKFLASYTIMIRLLNRMRNGIYKLT
jgi:hypothetical protein